ncbi:MAG: cupredoxin domain-containing protein [Solirubrobacteraceae bacterium]
MRRLAPTLLCSAALGLGLTACGSDTPSGGAPAGASAKAADGSALAIKVFQFTPQELTVTAGTKVTVSNDDEILHTWTSGARTDAQSGAPKDTPDGMFDVKLDGKGSTGEFTFQKAGTYTYYCAIHPGDGMTGTVVVD